MRHKGPMHPLSNKHHSRLRFGPKHHPLKYELAGHHKGQVRHKPHKWERGGVNVSAPKSRKNPPRIGWAA